MKNRKMACILVALFSAVIITGVLCYNYFIKIPTQIIAERCIGYDPEWEDLEDCYGVISIRTGWDINYYYLYDHIHGYEVARIFSIKQYFRNDGKIFVVNRQTIENASSNDGKTIYYQKLFQNGKVTNNSYNNISDIPTYLVINMQSGEVVVYKNIADVPQSEQSYFREIEGK